jgi:hypothetical protein
VTVAVSRSSRAPRVGDLVAFPFGTYEATGEVTEDRGPLGRGGERILRVSIDMGTDLEPLVTEIPERLTHVVPRPRGR